MVRGPSKHLSWNELACKDGTPYPFEWRGTRAQKLAYIFETIRSIWDKPITVNSAFRTPEHNRKINGARNSQHVQGRALDLVPPKGVSVNSLYEVIKELAPVLGITGIGKYKTFIHIDIRPSNRIAYWFGNGIKDSGTKV